MPIGSDNIGQGDSNPSVYPDWISLLQSLAARINSPGSGPTGYALFDQFVEDQKTLTVKEAKLHRRAPTRMEINGVEEFVYFQDKMEEDGFWVLKAFIQSNIGCKQQRIDNASLKIMDYGW